MILVVCTTSILILYAKPYDLTSKLFFIYLQLLAISQNFKYLFLDDLYALFATIAFIFSFNLFGVVLLHFHLNFPKPAAIYKHRKGLIKLFYLAGFLISIAVTLLLIRRNFSDAEGAISTFNVIRRWSVAWMGLTLSLALSVAIYQFISAKNLLVRRQLRLVVIGSVFGLITPILYSIYPEFIWKLENEQHMLSLLEFTNGIGTYIMTTFLAIAIFRFRFWNVEIFLRRALFYGIATVAIFLIYLSLLFLVDVFLIEESRGVHFLILAVAGSIFLLLRDTLQHFINRFFYRASYDSAKVVAQFEDTMSGIYKLDELKSSIVKCMDKIFHFKSFVFAQRVNHHTYKTTYLMGVDFFPENKEFLITDEIDELLRRSRIFSIDELRDKPRLFEVSNGELIVPLISGTLPSGFFILGPKQSQESYSLQDIRVLSLLARRVVSLFHTAQLYQKDLDRNNMLERERRRIAKDIHDDIGASMTRLYMLSEMAKNNLSDPDNTRQWLSQICDTCNEVMREMTQIIWALNPKNESFEGLVAYLRRFSFDYLEPTAANCHFELPEDLSEINLNIEKKRNIYLCFRETLNNLVKHSEAGNVWISFKKNEKDFIITIKDDGKGFDPNDREFHGNGLVNMSKRMKDIGGQYSVVSEPGKGTETTLLVPVALAIEP